MLVTYLQFKPQHGKCLLTHASGDSKKARLWKDFLCQQRPAAGKPRGHSMLNLLCPGLMPLPQLGVPHPFCQLKCYTPARPRPSPKAQAALKATAISLLHSHRNSTQSIMAYFFLSSLGISNNRNFRRKERNKSAWNLRIYCPPWWHFSDLPSGTKMWPTLGTQEELIIWRASHPD